MSRALFIELTHAISDIPAPSSSLLTRTLFPISAAPTFDRAQCEYSITTRIDASPGPDAESPRPIELDTESGPIKIYQRIGDALLYRGSAVAQSRDRLPDGFTSTSLLLHYVDESFTGGLD